MRLHIIESTAGCAFAVENGCVAVVVDALRASATASMLFEAGAVEIVAVREVDEARALKAESPDALLFGERGGLPPEGFDAGNSPRDITGVSGKRIIFTTTSGTARLTECAGAPAVYMGTTVNATAAMSEAISHGLDIVLVPASASGELGNDAQEDWAAATALALLTDLPVGEGAPWYREMRHRIELDGLAKLFETAPHADRLRLVGLGDDVAFCARMNVTCAVPRAKEFTPTRVELGLAAEIGACNEG